MTTTIQITPTRCIFNAGQFDSNYRYLRKTSSGVRTTMLSGPSFSVNLNTQYWIFSWRYRCGDYARSGQAKNSKVTVPLPSNPSNTPHTIAL